MEINEEHLKLLEENIVQSVHRKVEARLFRKYLAMGAFVAAVTGVFGWSVFESIEDRAGAIAQTAAEPAIKRAEAAVAQVVRQAETVVREAQTSVSNAQKAADKILLSIDSVDDYLERRENILFAVQADTSAQRRAAAAAQDEASAFFESAAKQSAELDAARKALAADFAELNEGLADYRQRTEAVSLTLRKVASAGDLETVADAVDVLGRQLQAVNEQLAELTEKVSTSSALLQEGADAGALDTVIANVAPEKARTTGDTTVYVQFAGVKRELIEAISTRLKQQGFMIPGEERTSIAAGKHEIRYFYADDLPRAQALQKSTKHTLLAMGLRTDITVEDFTSYAGAKPRRGVLELWLEP